MSKCTSKAQSRVLLKAYVKRRLVGADIIQAICPKYVNSFTLSGASQFEVFKTNRYEIFLE